MQHAHDQPRLPIEQVRVYKERPPVSGLTDSKALDVVEVYNLVLG